MSQNTGQYPLATSSLSSPSNNNKRTLSHQHFLLTSSDFNTPSSILNTSENDSPSLQTRTSPIVNDVCASGYNGVRNPSITTKIKDGSSPNGNHFNDKYAFSLELTPPVAKAKKDYSRKSKSQLYPFEMAENNEEDLHSPFELDVPLCENQSLKKIQNDFLIDRMLKDDSNCNYTLLNRSLNQPSYTNILNYTSPLLTPSSDHHDIDALSDAGTYIIEDDIDIAHDDEPEQDIEQQTDIQENNSPPSISTSSSFKRYAATKRNRHGTFDIQGVLSKTPQSVNRPIVDLHVPTHDLLSSSSSGTTDSSSSSSLLSLPTENDTSICKEPEGASHHIIDDKSSTGLVYARQRPNTLLPQQQRSVTPPQNPIKPAECFVISPTFETKPFPSTTSNPPRRKVDTQWKPKSVTSVVPTKDIHFEIPSKNSSPSPPVSARSNQSDTEKFSFRLQQQPTRQHDSKQQSSSSNMKSSLQNTDFMPSSSKSSLRPHSIISDQTSSSPFQRNSSIRQTMPANTQYHRALSTAAAAAAAATAVMTTAPKYIDDNDEILSSHPSLTKVYMNKSFALRRQRSNVTPSTTKPVQQQVVSKALTTRQTIKPTTSVPSTTVTSTSLSINNSSGQTNRAVELRRARAQAKIEELAQRTRHQLQKTEQHNDVMSASWHSNASSSSKKEFSHLRANPRSANNNNNIPQQRQDLLQTRTISSSSSSHHRSSSASPNPLGDGTKKTAKYRKAMVSSVTTESQYQKMNGSTYSEGERCDSLRDDGQRLAIKLIQLSSGILAKLKPNSAVGDSDSNVRQLEQLVDQLQTVNRTLTRTLTIAFKVCCDSLVDIFLSVSSTSLVNMEDRNADSNYEKSIIAWATHGQRLNNEKLSVGSAQERNDLQLIGMQIFFRHGARTPINLLPSLEEVVYSKEQIESYPPSKWDIKLITKKNDEIESKDKVLSARDVIAARFQKLKSTSTDTVTTGQLTSVGEKQLFQLGRRLRSEVIDVRNNNGLIPKTYDPKYVYCRSTYMDRTIASARSFLAGLFSSEESDNKIQATGPFEIEVHHFPDEDMFPNPNIAPILSKCHTVKSLYTSLTDDHELKKARQTLINRIGLTEYPHGIIELHDDIISRQAHNFTVPNDLLKLTQDFEILSAREYVYRATNIGFDLFIRSSCGSILYLIRENFNFILKNYLDEKTNGSKKQYQKFFIYSGHDSTIIPLALAFEIFDMRWPRYGAYIVLKYFISKTNKSETYVTVHFDGEPQILPDCEDHYCSYSTFLKSLQNRIDKPKKTYQA
ncbi:unnamed protein product [Rotaria socialis]|uniref:2-phosphoxylose phosphatase 1 n=1 Tax=Rotaria socialis TaxID=392032 RepID=A0A819YTK3_9BILA|nr:unnamed protein product [Rotaria socialis]